MYSIYTSAIYVHCDIATMNSVCVCVCVRERERITYNNLIDRDMYEISELHEDAS